MIFRISSRTSLSKVFVSGGKVAKIRLFFRRARAAFADTVGNEVIGDSVSSITKLFQPPFDVRTALFVNFARNHQYQAKFWAK